jgi:hypothetical protein
MSGVGIRMKAWRRVAATCVVLLAGLASVRAQSWTPVKNPPFFKAGTALLLTDGRVAIQYSSTRTWYTLTPDTTGSYQNGAWGALPSMPKGYAPLYFASAMLPDGRLAVLGGEYNNGVEDYTNFGAIYSPFTKTWQTLPAPSGWTHVGDAPSVVLANGIWMVGTKLTNQQALLNAATLTWTATGAGKADVNDEEGWTLLPSGEVLTVDTQSGNTNSEIYDPNTGSWSSAGSTIAQLVDANSSEIGPAVLRPDGTVLFTGATGHNAIFNSATSTWSVAPDFPKAGTHQLDIADGPAALLPSGNVLCMTSPGVYGKGAQFFEWDGTTFTAVAGTPNAPNDSSYVGRMVVLPTGQILLTDGTKDVELYNSLGTPDPAWAPIITAVPATLTHGTTATLNGMQLNGLSQGAAYGDDAQSASNYPLIRIINNATGHVFYARTHDFSSMGVATGSAIVSTEFDVPVRIERGASQLEVVTNGIASNPVSVTIN